MINIHPMMAGTQLPLENSLVIKENKPVINPGTGPR
jgi:hypothetical protein